MYVSICSAAAAVTTINDKKKRLGSIHAYEVYYTNCQVLYLKKHIRYYIQQHNREKARVRVFRINVLSYLV